MTELSSRVISSLRFPMIAAVIAIHCNFVIYYPELQQKDLFYFLFDLTETLICVSVPIFFFISGYLFFKEGTLDYDLYKKKITKRVHSLVIPYILWNVIYFIIIAVLQLIIPDFMFILHKSILLFSWQDYLWIFWDISKITHLPSDQASCLVGAFWFLQCLFLMCLISPILYVFIKYLKKAFIIIPLSIFFFFNFGLFAPGINSEAIIFFSIGAYLSMMKIDFAYYLQRIPLWLSLVIMILMMLCIVYDCNGYINLLCTLLLQISVLCIFSNLGKRTYWMNNNYLIGSIFFIFAIHRMFTATLIRISGKVIGILDNDVLLYFYYLLVIAIAILMSLLSYHVMLRLFPRLTNLLNGNRL